MTRPVGVTVGLVMIVKNEERTLPRLAESVRGQLDHWTIVDTGSTDETIGIAPKLFEGVSGEVVSTEWRGYGPSRNVSLQAARPYTDWLLLLDADHTISGTIDRDSLNDRLDCVEAEEHYHQLRLWRPFLIRSNAGWEWHGRAHEYLSMSDAPRSRQMSTFKVVHHADGGNRPDKLERERLLLEQDFAERPNDSRTVFYLARTHDDMGHAGQAAEFYRRRLQIGGWVEESWYARWRLGVCQLATGSVDQGCGTLWRAWGERPWRAEPLGTLAKFYREQQLWRLCWEVCQLARLHTGVQPTGPGPDPEAIDRLFVHTDFYTWRIAFEESICAYYVNEIDRGRSLCQYLLDRDDLPPEERRYVQDNLRFYRT
jgi:glycosyltransferase involved in cell wall biosynthesis